MNKPMTKQASKNKLLALLRTCAECRSYEVARALAEIALIKYIADPEITAAYKKIRKVFYS